MKDKKEQILGSIFGGAVGDSMGYSVEFMSKSQIARKFGKEGINSIELKKNNSKAIVSDDTQMTLFTADGLIWAENEKEIGNFISYSKSGVYQSYLRWLYTQTDEINNKFYLTKQKHESFDKKTILEFRELFERRAPGMTCLSALKSGRMGSILKPINASKGCGAIMRVAPVGLLLYKDPKEAFKVAAEIGSITHGDPTGYLSAGALAMIISCILNGNSIINSVKKAMVEVKNYNGFEETLRSMEKAIFYSCCEEDSNLAIKKLGEGWIGNETLGIGIYCAIVTKSFESAIIMAVNHNGDSDSTGAVCGNIVGAFYGIENIPLKWMKNIELTELIILESERIYNIINKKS